MKIILGLILGAVCLTGCVDVSSYRYDREHFRDRLNEQSHRIYQIEKDMIEIKRGYTIVPVKVTITNAAITARSENRAS